MLRGHLSPESLVFCTLQVILVQPSSIGDDFAERCSSEQASGVARARSVRNKLTSCTRQRQKPRSKPLFSSAALS